MSICLQTQRATGSTPRSTLCTITCGFKYTTIRLYPMQEIHTDNQVIRFGFFWGRWSPPVSPVQCIVRCQLVPWRSVRLVTLNPTKRDIHIRREGSNFCGASHYCCVCNHPKQGIIRTLHLIPLSVACSWLKCWLQVRFKCGSLRATLQWENTAFALANTIQLRLEFQAV